MKFAWKIFFISFLIIIVSFGVGGFLLVNSIFTSSLNAKVESVCDSNRYITASLYAATANSQPPNGDYNYLKYNAVEFAEQVAQSGSDTIVNITSDLNDVKLFNRDSFINKLSVNSRGHTILELNGKHYVQAVSKVYIVDDIYFVESIEDITDIYESRDSYCRMFQIILLGVALFASALLVVFSHFITKPLERLSGVSKQIAHGDFSKRAAVSGGIAKTKEVTELSQNFNTMAQYVEDYIAQLKAAAQSRDDFVAAFTHELKTPLTSVIGYADMLRSYELDAAKRRECADFIYREGKRLESLSLNLLNLIVLKKDEIKLIPVKSDVIIAETGSSVLFVLKRHGIQLETDFEHAEILAEPSLIKTLLYNLIDNACKASRKGQTVKLSGFCKGDRYYFSVSDNGRGIPKRELNKITEPFYMVDKSRSRKMGGAGLGLALCSQIAELHGSELKIESSEGAGTTVGFSAQLAEVSDNE